MVFFCLRSNFVCVFFNVCWRVVAMKQNANSWANILKKVSLLAHLLFFLFWLMVSFYLWMCMVNLNVPNHLLCVLSHSNDKKKHVIFTIAIIIFFNWTCSPPSFSFHGFFLFMAIYFFKVEFCSWTCLHVCYKVVIAITKPNSQTNLSFFKKWACLPPYFSFYFGSWSSFSIHECAWST